MKIDYNGIVIIVGNYGSGKTEVAINLAVHQKNAGKNVQLADLDLVNPYFRTREARTQLQEIGIKVVLPHEQYMTADLPILSPNVAALIRKENLLAILDAGGDDVGATVLAALADSLEGRAIQMLQVINPFRPYTDTVAGCRQTAQAIEAASKLPITGIIGNANLMDQTLSEHVYHGYRFVNEVSRESGLPLECITIAVDLQDQVDLTRIACPVLTIRRQLVPPWQKPESLGAAP
jgi:hypothetical protein